jgi:hypothetical protein
MDSAEKLMNENSTNSRREQLRTRLRQLILLRETGPKNPAWHTARMNLIWRTHDELARASDEADTQEQKQTGEKAAPR